MSKTTKVITASIISLVVIFILIMTWFYPFSIFSVYKTYSYSPDPVMVGEYVRDINDFEEKLENDLKDLYSNQDFDLTLDRSQYIFPFFKQDWLLSKDPLKMKKSDLDNLLFDVENTRDNLLDLVEKVDYSIESKNYLMQSIRDILALEKDLLNLKNNSFASKKDLRIQFHNLHVSYMNSFMMFSSFYDASRDERLALLK
ncbi:hypothetical protein [Ornithinibacillus halotolerans]|uniref:Uncharacterized protein n=1 Tax=Ornithinibacillus halotolerans TaxID=1274357 RepID=A0A916RV59_9BACI|nr:hypothetical protein [Ornithinibacillus halotolerans]GGA67805.1 hypothetical protein GCM10008025_09570 [Ornithinibacillus halotolerans]